VGNYAVTKVAGVRFNTKLETARELAATKMEEKVDTVKLKKLYNAGVKFEGINEFEYVRVKELKEAE
jgi:hypothetical protein